MPDFAIIPEFPTGYTIDSKRSVARLVSVQTVIASQTPTVASVATETDLFTVVSLVGLPIASPGDQPVQDLSAPSVPRVATETGMSPYASAVEAARASPGDQPVQDLSAPSVPATVTERASASARVA